MFSYVLILTLSLLFNQGCTKEERLLNYCKMRGMKINFAYLNVVLNNLIGK